MTLFDLLTAISFFLPIGIGATAGGKNGAFVGLPIGIVVGSVIGVVAVRAIRIGGAWALRGFDPQKADTPGSLARGYLLLLAILAWIMISSFLAGRFTEFVVHAVAAKA